MAYSRTKKRTTRKIVSLSVYRKLSATGKKLISRAAKTLKSSKRKTFRKRRY